MEKNEDKDKNENKSRHRSDSKHKKSKGKFSTPKNRRDYRIKN